MRIQPKFQGLTVIPRWLNEQLMIPIGDMADVTHDSNQSQVKVLPRKATAWRLRHPRRAGRVQGAFHNRDF